MIPKAFCENCRTMEEYKVKQSMDATSIKNVKVNYMEKTCYCVSCGNEVFVGEIMDENLKNIEKVYKMIVK